MRAPENSTARRTPRRTVDAPASGPRARWLSVAAALALGVAGLGAAPATAAQATCLLGLIGSCSTPSPTPTSTPSPSDTGAAGADGTGTDGGSGTGGDTATTPPSAPGVVVGVPGGDGTITVPGELPPSTPDAGDGTGPTGAGSSDPGDTAGPGGGSGSGSDAADDSTPLPPLLGTPDPTGTVFSSKPATLQGSSIDITGLRGAGVVAVPTGGGGHVLALEIDCDRMVVHDLVMTVDQPDSRLVTTSPALSLSGDVHSYLTGIGGTIDGERLSFSPDRLPSLEQLQGLVQVTLQYLGSTADYSSWPGVHEEGIDK